MAKKDDDDKVVDVVPLEEKLGPDLIEKIAEKEWKKADLPTEEQLEKEKHSSPKARKNINSRKNLVQYRKNVSKDTKKKIVKGLATRQKRRNVNPLDYIDIPDSLESKSFLSFLPRRKVFRDDKEEESFYRVLNIFLKDFDPDELGASDIEDIISLAKNKVIEDRLLVAGAEREGSEEAMSALLDVSASIEKLRKHSEKIKQGLASRRSDRIDPRNKQNFSIVDLVQRFDDRKREELEVLEKRFRKEEAEFLRKKNISEQLNKDG